MTTPVYQADGVTLYCGDCREVLPEIGPAGCVLVTDPPYGIAHESNYKVRAGAGWSHAQSCNTQIANDNDTSARDLAFAWIAGGPAAIFGTPKVARIPGWRGVLAWNKGPSSGMGDLSFPWKPSWEEVAVYGAGWAGRRDGAVLNFPQVSRECMGRVHPNEKPPPLLAHIIGKAPPALTVVDPFAGSGSTGVAAKALSRRCVLVEIEPKYCEIIIRRLAQRELFGSAA